MSMPTKPLPAHEGAERLVLGALLLSSAGLDDVMPVLRPNPTKVLNTNGLFQEWFYRADLGQWVKLSALTEIDNLPFPDEFESFFILLLAMRLNPRYGRSMDEQSAAIFKQGRTSFVARYLQSMPLEIDDSISWPFMSMQSYDQQRQFSSSPGFDRGGYFYWGN